MTEREPAPPGALADELHVSLPPTRLAAHHDAFSYRIIDSPLGDLLVARTPSGIARVAFAREGFSRVLESLSEQLHPRPVPARSSLDHAARAIDAYFAGTASTISLPIDLQLVTGFQRTVIDHLPSIGYGATASYAAVAAGVGRPGASNAVGVACRSNPLPIVMPCHRAVRSDGSLGAYVGGTEAKRVLLALEAS
ncbi:MAG: methylated-DNA--[protein]-cysteine S-methyltransferase [Cumulibacter sp.]